MVNSKQMSLRVAAAAYGVPSTTISDHKNKVSKSNKIGRPPILSQEIEKLLVDGLIKLADGGFGLTCVGNKILTVGPPSERTKNNNYAFL